ncbi:hypothetical protein GCM10007939_08230 [Amylibacter marinus]|uniref:YjiS-like domain-containing protein n=1 Tax=Amylibacter marinus TaxID=1475483 RepID=A0ABQ5VTE2_9RHOB|nr:DUF1127 domain-containing protein [Amylibacter marinus]GLQ34540.1 hypothetical protein GCM10007939_08230 [Amylibacter marinus]
MAATLKSFAVFATPARLVAIPASLLVIAQIQKQRRALARLSPAQLSDIGLTASQAKTEAARFGL